MGITIISKDHGPYFHLGLGQWVKNEADKRVKLAAAGLVEVGDKDSRGPKHRGKSPQEIREMYGIKEKPKINSYDVRVMKAIGCTDKEIAHYYAKMGAE
jgi:hypothetical protein